MEGKDNSESKEESPPTQPQAQSIETNGGVLEEVGVMEGKDTSESKEQSPPTQPQAQSIETNEGVLVIKVETAGAISKSTEKQPPPQGNVTNNRRRMPLLRAALFMLRRGSDEKSKSVHVEVGSKGLWRRLVGSMRPLHLHDHQSQPALALPPPPDPEIGSFHKLQPSPMSLERRSSPSSSPFFSASSSPASTSRYASAPDLQELGRRAECDCDDDVDRTDEFINCGDEMIDTKAEEFIANFYEQMRLQRIQSIK